MTVHESMISDGRYLSGGTPPPFFFWRNHVRAEENYGHWLDCESLFVVDCAASFEMKG